jgi:hypothetical protein
MCHHCFNWKLSYWWMMFEQLLEETSSTVTHGRLILVTFTPLFKSGSSLSRSICHFACSIQKHDRSKWTTIVSITSCIPCGRGSVGMIDCSL